MSDLFDQVEARTSPAGEDSAEDAFGFEQYQGLEDEVEPAPHSTGQPTTSPAAAAASGAAPASVSSSSPASAAAGRFSGGVSESKFDAEPNALNEFNQRFRERCEEMDAKEREQVQERRRKADAEVRQFYDDRERTKEGKQKTNRDSERAFLDQLAAEADGGNPWERVVSMVDTKAAEDTAADTSRMRSILIQLKNHPVLPSA